MRRRDELALIEYFKKVFRRRRSSIVKGIGDDAAVIAVGKNKRLLFTADMLIEGRHFKKTDRAFDIGWKAMACSASDIAAMGGEPCAALVSLGLPKRWRFSKVASLSRGIKKAAERFGVAIIGGDTNAADTLIVDVAMVGFAPHGALPLRSAAKSGDFIFVTGHLGGSLYGRHLRFEPRVREVQFLQKHIRIHAMIDISDGLALDLSRIAKASRVGAVLFKQCIPLHRDARNFDEALSMGEDFELLFTADEKQAAVLLDMIEKKKIGFPVSFIGRVINEKNKIYLIDSVKRRITILPPKGFLHFYSATQN